MDLNKELGGIAAKVNRTPARVSVIGGTGGGAGAAPRYDFVNLGEKVADSMVKAAEEQLTAAQNQLEEIKAWADNLKAGLREKDAELATMNEKLRMFGESIMSAHRSFTGVDHRIGPGSDGGQNEPMPTVVTQGPRSSE
jgi:hypothetical protein